MAPSSQSTLRGNKKPSWEVAQHCQHLRDQPAIRMEPPQKKPKDTPEQKPPVVLTLIFLKFLFDDGSDSCHVNDVPVFL